MPMYTFEAMDATGQEIRDTIEAPNEDKRRKPSARWATSSRRSLSRNAASRMTQGQGRQETRLRHRRRQQQGT